MNKVKKMFMVLLLVLVGYSVKAATTVSGDSKVVVRHVIYYNWNNGDANAHVKKLHEIGKWLAGNKDTDVIITGWADAKGGEAGSKIMAGRRAEKVAEWLKTNYSIASNRMTVKNGGIDRSVSSDKARRVDVAEIVIVKPVVEEVKEEVKKPVEEVKEVVKPVEEVKEVVKETTPPVVKKDRKSQFSLRTNLLRLVTLTGDLGIEYRLNNWSIVVHGTSTYWRWNDNSNKYYLWQVSPEIRHYFGAKRRWYAGLAYQIGEYDYKFGDTKGYQSTDKYNTYGLVAGYNLPISNRLSLDLGVGAGYTESDYEKYGLDNGVFRHYGSATRYYWGVNQASVTLSWSLCK